MLSKRTVPIDTSKDIDKILDNLKPAKLNKNNMVISSEDVQKIKNYTKDVKEYNPDSKNCKRLKYGDWRF